MATPRLCRSAPEGEAERARFQHGALRSSLLPWPGGNHFRKSETRTLLKKWRSTPPCASRLDYPFQFDRFGASKSPAAARSRCPKPHGSPGRGQKMIITRQRRQRRIKRVAVGLKKKYIYIYNIYLYLYASVCVAAARCSNPKFLHFSFSSSLSW